MNAVIIKFKWPHPHQRFEWTHTAKGAHPYLFHNTLINRSAPIPHHTRPIPQGLTNNHNRYNFCQTHLRHSILCHTMPHSGRCVALYTVALCHAMPHVSVANTWHTRTQWVPSFLSILLFKGWGLDETSLGRKCPFSFGTKVFHKIP